MFTRILAAFVLVSVLSGCAAHTERAKMGVQWVEEERAMARALARQGFSSGGRE